MKNKHIVRPARTAFPLLLLVALVLFQPVRSLWMPAAKAQDQPKTTVADGVRTVTVDGPEGRVTVKVPADIRSGDTISGTLTQEPKGSTPDEVAKNEAAMRKKMVRLMLSRIKTPGSISGGNSGTTTTPVVLTVPLDGGNSSTVQTQKGKLDTTRIQFNVPAVTPPDYTGAQGELGRATVPVDIVTSGAKPSPTPAPTPRSKDHGPSAGSYTEDIPPGPAFVIPPLGQRGHPIQITGPFDGDSSNTLVDIKRGSQPDVPLDIIAESPRQTIVMPTADITGPGQITVHEGGTTATGPFRWLGVSLSAPKTNLLKGERTELRVVVSGLDGIIQPVPLTLEAHGVITMAGGQYQPLFIQPNEVAADGSFTLTRGITGIMAGGWTAGATVVVPVTDCDFFTRERYYDFLGRDDTDGGVSFWISSFNGDFRVTGPGGATFEGTGKIRFDGDDVRLSYDKGGLRFDADIDTRAGTAEATLRSARPKMEFTITDRDIRDNIAACR